MTTKQHDFIVRLIEEKDTTSLSPEQQRFLPLIASDGAANLTPAQASRVIETLLALPRKATAGYPARVEHDVPAGRYAVINPSSGVTEFYRVDRPEDGKWAGYVFVKQQASDDLYPVKGARRDEVLGRIAVDPQAAMIRYGHELGRCGNCGRTLTDEVSRAMGIGPDCAAKLGIERIALEDVVAPAAASPDPAPVEAEREVTDVTRREPKLGWREEKAAIKAQQSDAQSSRGEWRARALATGRIHEGELPGSTWEDIFGM